MPDYAAIALRVTATLTAKGASVVLKRTTSDGTYDSLDTVGVIAGRERFGGAFIEIGDYEIILAPNVPPVAGDICEVAGLRLVLRPQPEAIQPGGTIVAYIVFGFPA